jgi:hypothetical protein
VGTYLNYDPSSVGGNSGTAITDSGNTPTRVQTELWTMPSGATAGQSDFIKFNYTGLYALSMFLAIDGNGTYPTDPTFFQAFAPSFNPDITQVDILSTDTAVQVVAKFLAAFSIFNTAILSSCTDPIFVDNLDGTISVTYQTVGPVAYQTVPLSADGSSSGTIGISSIQSGEIQKVATVSVDGDIPKAEMLVSGNSGTSTFKLEPVGLNYISPVGPAFSVSDAGVGAFAATVSAQEYRSPLGQIIVTPRLTDDASPDNARFTLTDANGFGATLDFFAQASSAAANIYAHTLGLNGQSEMRLASDSSGEPFFFAKATNVGGNEYASWNTTPTISGLAVFDTSAGITAAQQVYNNAGEPEVALSIGGGTGTGFRTLRLVNDKLTLKTGGTTPYDGTIGIALKGSGGVEILGTQVLTAQQAAVPDATGGAIVDAEARTAINDLLARLRAHGLIA